MAYVAPPYLKKLGADQTATDTNLAAAIILERYAKLLRANGNSEDLARELLPIIVVMARQP